VTNVEASARQTLVDSSIEHHTERPYVDTRTRRGGDVEKLYLLRSEDREMQVFGFIVDASADRPEWYFVGHLAIDINEDFAAGDRDVSTYVFAKYFHL
jgi:hypothetical protein